MKKILCIIFISIFIENAYGFDFAETDIHGFISQGFMISDRNNYYANTEDGTFEFNEMGINFSNQINDRLRIGMQFFSRDLGNIGNNEVALDWAIGDYRWQDWLGLRAGRIKNRCGFYGYTRDIDMLRTSIFLPQGVYFEGMREPTSALDGVGIYGYVPITDSGSIDYQMNYGNYRPEEDKGFSKLMETHLPVDILEFESNKMFVMNLEWNTGLKGLRLGGTHVRSDIKADALTSSSPIFMANGIPPGMNISLELDGLKAVIVSAEYTWKDLLIAAEYLSAKGDMSIAGKINQKFDYEGYYGSISYRFTDWFETGVYYSVNYFNKSDKEGKRYAIMGLPDYLAWQKEFVLSTKFDINENWTFKAEGHFINGAEMMFLEDNPDGWDESSFMFAIKTTFNF